MFTAVLEEARKLQYSCIRRSHTLYEHNCMESNKKTKQNLKIQSQTGYGTRKNSSSLEFEKQTMKAHKNTGLLLQNLTQSIELF